jgi:hypothetical protein
MAAQPAPTPAQVQSEIQSDFARIGKKTVRLDELIDRTVEEDKRNHGVPSLQNAERQALQGIFEKAAKLPGNGMQTRLEAGEQVHTYVPSQFLAISLEAAARINPAYAEGLEKPMAAALAKCEAQSPRLVSAKPATPKGP